MRQNNRLRMVLALALSFVLVVLAACSNANEENNNANSAANNTGNENAVKEPELKKLKLVLDYMPNTNHTGAYVAQANGYFKEQGLDVEIILPGDAQAAALVATGVADFGFSYQEDVTYARTAEEPLPIVSLAAVIQHNTSGFASHASKNITSPKDFEGKSYGGWGSPAEHATIEAMMKADGADFSKINIMSGGGSDFFIDIEKNQDLAWIYYAWTGVEAELRGVPLNVVYLRDYDKALDYYTPVLITSEDKITNDAETVRGFMTAISQGYEFAIEQPEEAARILLEAEPDLDENLVIASQKWLSPRYQDDAPRWGEQKSEVWQNYADWMKEYELLTSDLDVAKAFTNEFLPE